MNVELEYDVVTEA